MKVAIITDDGKTVSQHFGRAPYYLVVTIENGAEVSRELREKVGHHTFANEGHEEHHENHGQDAGSHHKHGLMAQSIADCETVVCGGMGMGAYESMRRLNITPVVTDLRDVELVIQSVIKGNLSDHTELLH